MKNLIDIAIGEAFRRAAIERRGLDEMHRTLANLKKGAINQVKQLEGQKCGYGTFSLSVPFGPVELLSIECIKSPTVTIPVLVLSGWITRYPDKGGYREEPRIWAYVHSPTESTRVVSTKEEDGLVALEPFLEDLGKALSSWFYVDSILEAFR
jgi:hypothetical protein